MVSGDREGKTNEPVLEATKRGKDSRVGFRKVEGIEFKERTEKAFIEKDESEGVRAAVRRRKKITEARHSGASAGNHVLDVAR